MNTHSLIRIAAIALMTVPASAAFAQSAYPVSGKWTYENASAEGPAKDCGKRFMNFQSPQRFDTGGGVPSYRNISVDNTGSDTYRIVDEFSTGQINARSSYTLRKIDADHIVIQVSSHTIPLRRCE